MKYMINYIVILFAPHYAWNRLYAAPGAQGLMSHIHGPSNTRVNFIYTQPQHHNG